MPYRSNQYRIYSSYLLFIGLPFEALGVHIYADISIKILVAYIFILFNLSSVLERHFDVYDKIILIFLYTIIFSWFMNAFLRPESLELYSFHRDPNLSWVRGPYHIYKFLFLFMLYKLTKEVALLSSNAIIINSLLRVVLITTLAIIFYGIYQSVGDVIGLPFTNLNNLHKIDASSILTTYYGSYFRIFSVFGEPKGYASYLVFVIPMFFSCLVSNRSDIIFKKLPTKVKLMFCFLCVLSLMLTFSRSAFVSIIITAVVCVLMFKAIISKYKKLLVRLMLVIGVSILLWINIGFFYGVESSTKKMLIDPFASHLPQVMESDEAELVGELSNVGHNSLTIKQSIELLKESPLLGFGPGQFAIQAELRHWATWKFGRLDTVHGPTNFIAYMLGNLGLLGSLLLILFVCKHIRAAQMCLVYHVKKEGFTYDNHLHLGILTSSIASWMQFLIMGGLDFYYPFIALGLLAAMNRIRRVASRGLCKFPNPSDASWFRYPSPDFLTRMKKVRHLRRVD